MVQFTDAHLDLEYVEGASTECGLVMCCRKESGSGQGEDKAGKWGSFGDMGCDAPERVF